MTRSSWNHVAACVCGAGVTLAAGVLPLAYAPPQELAFLAGVVVSADAQPEPVRRAVVMLTGPELSTNLSAITDDQGAFAFVNLRPGNYTVTGSKAAYLTTALGAKRPGQPGTSLAIAAGQRVTGVRLMLPRGAVLTGVVRDGSGAPATNLQITIVEAAKVNGPSSYSSPPEGPILTDDQGQYRAYGLAPGEYLVAVSPRLPGRDSLVRLPAPTIDTVMRDLQARASGRATAGPPASPASALQPLTYAPILYPGTPVAQEAARIRVAAGEVRDGLDFTVDLVPSAKISGRIVVSDGSALPPVQLSLTPVGPPLPVFSSLNFMPRQSPDGTFSFTNLSPGRYLLIAVGTPGAPAGITSAGGRGGVTFSSGPQAGGLWAMADLSVSGVDLDGVMLTMRPALTFSGRIAFDAATLAPPADLTKIRVGLLRSDGANPVTSLVNGVPVFSGLPLPVAATVRPDTTFSVGGVLPGVYVPSATVPGAPGWWLRSAIVGGRDVMDLPLDLAAAATDVSGAVLTFSDRRSELAGTLQAASGQAATAYFVIVFPADRALWQASRRLKSTRPASDGRFSVSDLPAGDYLIAALTDLDPDEWRAAAFLEQAAGAAVKVTIADGARVTQDLRLR